MKIKVKPLRWERQHAWDKSRPASPHDGWWGFMEQPRPRKHQQATVFLYRTDTGWSIWAYLNAGDGGPVIFIGNREQRFPTAAAAKRATQDWWRRTVRSFLRP